ncbi:MAG: GTP-binding protein [Spirochaetales bacterium]|nr:GTP-binding protein [Spirochaetales bacterium]
MKKQAPGNAKVPVTLLTGFLGSGKSTVLNRLLKERPHEKFGVLLNEFGRAALESQVVETRREPVFEMPAGCLCCVADGEIQKALTALLEKDPGLTRILVEASGLTSPASVLEILSAESNEKFRLAGVWAVADAQTFLEREKEMDIVRRQLKFADAVLLTKTDLVSSEIKKNVEARLAQLKPGIPVFSTNARLPWNALLDQWETDFLLTQAERDAQQTEVEKPRGGKRFFRAEHHHDDVKIWEFEFDKPLRPDAVRKAYELSEPGLLRSKGVLYLDDPSGQQWKYIVQFSGGQKQLYSRAWEKNEEKKTSLIFLGTAFDESRLEATLLEGIK